MTFRPDINGLRAIAVLMVVFFHFEVPGFAGGFIGVDVFFVISGFLMTAIIFGRFESQQFSLSAFYLARCRRIIPALFFLGLVLGSLHYFVLSSPEYMLFSRHLASSLTFVSNFVYQSESGYFDTGAYSKWLLHTWSLSIEWQFYILYPLVLIILRDTWHLAVLKWSVLCLFLMSLIASLYMSGTDASNAFFMPHARAWEFLAGAIVFFFPLQLSKRASVLSEWSGLLFIMLACTLLSRQNTWPGPLTVLPVAGTVLLLYANNASSIVTGNRIAQFVGSISYSFYLWHWPIVVALWHYGLNDSLPIVFLGFCLSVILATLSWEYIENRRYRIALTNVRQLLIYATLPVLTGVAFYQAGMSRYEGLNSTINFTRTQLDSERGRYWGDIDWDYPFDADGDTHVLVIGNSYAIDLIYALKTNGLKGAISLLGTKHFCTSFGLNPLQDNLVQDCIENNERIVNSPMWDDKIDVVFVHDNYENFDVNQIRERISYFRSRTDAPIYLFGPKMDFSVDALGAVHTAVENGRYTSDAINEFALRSGRDRALHNRQLQLEFDRQLYLEQKIFYVDLLSSQCGRELRCSVLNDDFELLYFDNGHLTLVGATQMGEQLKQNYPNLFYQ